MTRVAILQSNYIPWKGYFDIIKNVDLFVFYDDVQYTARNWRNRNTIKTKNGLEWLTIPCGDGIHRLINQVKVDRGDWQIKHWEKIEKNYSMAPFWREYRDFFSKIYLEKKWSMLSEFNQNTISLISRDIFGFKTKFDDSSKFNLTSKGAEKVIDTLLMVGATYYLSGPSARNYLKDEDFVKSGIALEYMDYNGYPEYPQQHGGPFVHEVSVIDLIFNAGPSAIFYLKRDEKFTSRRE